MLGYPPDVRDGDRFRIVAEFDTPKKILGKGPWHLVHDRKPARIATRFLVGPSKRKAEWMTVKNTEPIRVLGPNEK